jgi:predicted amidophosphoribosyltransferase
MRFVYKINSSFDGFDPSQIPARLDKGDSLKLGWKLYSDQVSLGQEVWVYFRGRGVRPGVYARGTVRANDPASDKVILKVTEYATQAPLSDEGPSSQLAALVKAPGRQVFVLPEAIQSFGFCTLSSSASSCAARKCARCPTWKSLPLIGYEDFRMPPSLTSDLADFLPAYWVIPKRSSFVRSAIRIRLPIQRTSETFYRFKFGDSKIAYPLALGMYDVLRRQRRTRFDAIVPIPLSPDKAAAGELHRAGALARHLGQLLGVRVVNALTLNRPISKRKVKAELGPYGFHSAYRRALVVDDSVKRYDDILLVDDTCTWGDTLTAAFDGIRNANPTAKVVAATAGQMILKGVVVKKSLIVA